MTPASASFLPDTFLASRNRWKVPHKTLDRTALSTHWAGGKYIEGIEEGLLQIVYLGGDKKLSFALVSLDGGF